MRLASPIAARRARLEIIPLIDIMFFLLASFMMVSITMIRAQTMQMDLPTPTAAQAGQKPQMIRIEVDDVGDAFVVEGGDRVRVTLPQLQERLRSLKGANPAIPAYIQGHPRSTHGQVLSIVDVCRLAGIEKVSFDLSPREEEAP
jgi:biopolymer transport protein ExbD